MDDVKPKETKPLYIYFLVYQLAFTPESKPTKSLLYIYPGLAEKDRHIISQLPDFCFPDWSTFPRKTLSSDEKTHFFTLSGSSKQYGFVLRDMASKSHKHCPTAFCIFTDHPMQSLFDQLLVVLSKFYRSKDLAFMDEMSLFIRNQPLPDQGDVLNLPPKIMTETNPIVRDHEPYSIFNTDTFEKLIISLEPFEIAVVFLSMLLERRMIFVSGKLSYLGDCVHAAASLLWPMSWQHVFIPILPPNKLDFVCAPMPFVVGILSNDLETVQSMPMDEAIFVHLEQQTSISGKVTAFNLLPPHLFYPLMACFQEVKNIVLEAADLGKRPELTLLKNGIISFMIQILRRVPNFIQQGKFNAAEFIQATEPSLQPFVKELTNSQLFNRYKNQFTTPKIDEPSVQEFVMLVDSFDQEMVSYSTPEFYLKSGWLYKQTQKGVGPNWNHHFVVLNHSCLLFKSKIDTELNAVLALQDILEVLEVQDSKYVCLSIKTENSNYLVGDDNYDSISQWKQLIEYAIKHVNRSEPLLIPVPKKKKNFLKKVGIRGVTRRSGSVSNMVIAPSLGKKKVAETTPSKLDKPPPKDGSPSSYSLKTRGERKASVSFGLLKSSTKKETASGEKTASLESDLGEGGLKKIDEATPPSSPHTPPSNSGYQPDSSGDSHPNEPEDCNDPSPPRPSNRPQTPQLVGDLDISVLRFQALPSLPVPIPPVNPLPTALQGSGGSPFASPLSSTPPSPPDTPTFGRTPPSPYTLSGSSSPPLPRVPLTDQKPNPGVQRTRVGPTSSSPRERGLSLSGGRERSASSVQLTNSIPRFTGTKEKSVSSISLVRNDAQTDQPPARPPMTRQRAASEWNLSDRARPPFPPHPRPPALPATPPLPPSLPHDPSDGQPQPLSNN